MRNVINRSLNNLKLMLNTTSKQARGIASPYKSTSVLVIRWRHVCGSDMEPQQDSLRVPRRGCCRISVHPSSSYVVASCLLAYGLIEVETTRVSFVTFVVRFIIINVLFKAACNFWNVIWLQFMNFQPWSNFTLWRGLVKPYNIPKQVQIVIPVGVLLDLQAGCYFCSPKYSDRMQTSTMLWKEKVPMHKDVLVISWTSTEQLAAQWILWQ